MPRNKRQITNIQYRQRQKFRLTHDALYNLHELAFDTDGFVKVITTFPSLIVICGLASILTELDLTLQLDYCPEVAQLYRCCRTEFPYLLTLKHHQVLNFLVPGTAS